MKKILILILLLATMMLLSGIGKLAEQPTRQLEPLPSLEISPDYGPDTYITFVHC